MTTMFFASAPRRCAPVDRWPQQDRQLWQAALQPGDLLEEGGCRAERSKYSNREIEKGYGRWLAWLDSDGLLDADVAPGDRITRRCVRAYAKHLEGENASGTVIARIIELKVVAAILDPTREWSWIYRIASPIRARHKPARPKRPRLVHSRELFDLGLKLMAKAEGERTALRRFRVYRDGLLIAFLASRQLRLRNLTGLILGQTLVQQGGGWWIQIPAAETKTKEAIEMPWPDGLVPHLEMYLADHRAGIVALRGSNSNALWLSMHGSAMTDNAIYIRIVARTRSGLSKAINPHLFRDSATTSIAIDDPAHIGIAPRMLSHRNQSTTERYYNQARSIEATRRMQESLLARRKKIHDPAGTTPQQRILRAGPPGPSTSLNRLSPMGPRDEDRGAPDSSARR
jgi:integrase/recombinase XerD